MAGDDERRKDQELPTMEEILAKVKELPPLPGVVHRVVPMIQDPEVEIRELAKVLSTDQALTARILKLANSAFYGFPRRISTVMDAIVLLGLRTLKGLIYAIALYDYYDKPTPGYGMKRGDLWRHALATGVAARTVASDIRRLDPEEAFVCGLLHDIGKTVLETYVIEAFEQIYTKVVEDGKTFAEAEREVLGFDHAELGAKVVEQWNLPEVFSQAILHLYRPLEAPEEFRLMAAVVHLANHASLALGIGMAVDGTSGGLDPGVLELIGKDEGYLSDLLDRLQASLSDLEELAVMEAA